MVAADIMRKRVITARPDMTLRELARIFTDHHISGAPVVDGHGHLVGVVSQTDLVRFDRETPPAEVENLPSYYRDIERGSGPVGIHLEAPDFTRVKDVMTPAVLTGEEDTPVRDLARLMLRRHIHRVVIVRESKLCGIVTSMDLLKALVDLLDQYEPDSRARSAGTV